MAESFDYDVVVIGAGPGGEGAAMKSVKSSRQVVVIDDKPKVGGNCTHRRAVIYPIKLIYKPQKRKYSKLNETRN